MNWIEGEEHSLNCSWQSGEIVVEGQILLGGDGFWRAYIVKTKLGRLKKRGNGRVPGEVLACISIPMKQTRDEALRLAEIEYQHLTGQPVEAGAPIP